MNIGILLDNLGASQLSFLAIYQLSRVAQKYNVSPSIFYKNLAPTFIRPQFAHFNVADLWKFNGILITTSIVDTLFCQNLSSNIKKIFYVYDLEWLRPNRNNFLINISAYRNPKFTLIARSETHANEIENYCNIKPSIIVESLDLVKIYDKIIN